MAATFPNFLNPAGKGQIPEIRNNITYNKYAYSLGAFDTMDSQDGLNIFFYFLPAAALCDDFSLVNSVKT